MSRGDAALIAVRPQIVPRDAVLFWLVLAEAVAGPRPFDRDDLGPTIGKQRRPQRPCRGFREFENAEVVEGSAMLARSRTPHLHRSAKWG
jgi:hypothetical protein